MAEELQISARLILKQKYWKVCTHRNDDSPVATYMESSSGCLPQPVYTSAS